MYHDLYTDEAREAIKGYGLPAAGYFCSYAPVEIMSAAGFMPVRVSGLRGATGAADSLMHTNICPYIKGCLEALESGKLDFLSAAVFTSGCDAQRRLYDVFRSRRPELPAFLVVVPKKTGRAASARLAAEYAAMLEWIHEQFGKRVSEDEIARSVKEYVYLRGRARAFDGARRRRNPSVMGTRTLEIMLMIQRMPAREAVALINDEEERIRPVKLENLPRVLLAGNVMDDPAFVRMIEDRGVNVFADDLCVGRRFWMMPEPKEDLPLLESLADAYLGKHPCPRMAAPDDSVAHMRKLVENLKPDGVIFHILKFCDTHLYNVPAMRDLMRELDVRSLFVESDYSAAAGQAETRIQAFIETL